METSAVSYGSKKKRRIVDAIVLAMLTLVAGIMCVPIFTMLTTSVKTTGETFQYPPTFIPQTFDFSAYVRVFQKLDLVPHYLNSLFVSILIVIGTLVSSSLIAYGFSRYRAPGKKVLFMLVMSTLMIPYPSVMIPQYILFNKIRWVDTYLPLVVPAFLGSAYMIFLLKQFFSSISNELFDAARIDGCSEFKIFYRIVLPLSKAALASVAIFSFMWSWDDLLGPVIYLSSPEKYTLPVLLAGLVSKFRIPEWNIMMVAALYAALPCILLFIFCQRYFVEGIVTSGIKG
ncbi:MAG: carbohydrate ABC transporter permease [Lachnospiraceae bacterium]|nr:carbohydrate ABC transporter permease [Lachnospiraceae bacterium]